MYLLNICKNEYESKRSTFFAILEYLWENILNNSNTKKNMNPFENINFPNEDNWTSIECGSGLTADINRYFESEGRYLNQEDAEGILSRLWDDINLCHNQTRESFADLNADMLGNGINLLHWGIWEERFLTDLNINKEDLLSSTINFPSEYSLRVSGDWVVFSDMEGNPIINYNAQEKAYSEPWFFTKTDSMDDNVNGAEYVLAEAMLEKWKTDEAEDSIDDILKEGSIQIDDLDNPASHETIARLYWIDPQVLSNALIYFSQKIHNSPNLQSDQNPNMRILPNWDFQISINGLEDWDHHIVNYTMDWSIESEYTF